MPMKSGVYVKPVLRDCFDSPSRESDLECKDPSLAQQQFRDEADINTLMERFKVTGQMPVGGGIAPSYGDFSGISDYRTALHSVMDARDKFMLLPAHVRARFSNDPQQLLEFCADPANLAEATKLGLTVPAKQDVGVSGAKAPDAKPASSTVTPPAS